MVQERGVAEILIYRDGRNAFHNQDYCMINSYPDEYTANVKLSEMLVFLDVGLTDVGFHICWFYNTIHWLCPNQDLHQSFRSNALSLWDQIRSFRQLTRD